MTKIRGGGDNRQYINPKGGLILWHEYAEHIYLHGDLVGRQQSHSGHGRSRQVAYCPCLFHQKKWPDLSHLKGSTAAKPMTQKKPRRYYSQICSQLHSFDNVLILGPDENKFHLKEYMEENIDHLGELNTKVAGHMATGDIIKLVRKYFLKTQSLSTE